MVSIGYHWTHLSLFLAQAPARPLIQRIDPARNVALVMALLGLVLVGITLVACIMIGGHWVRRIARGRPQRKTFSPNNNESWRAVLAETRSPDSLPEGEPGETILSDAPTDETRAD